MIKHFYCPDCNSITSSLVDSIITTNDPRIFSSIRLNRHCECGSIMEEIDSGIILTIKNLNDAKLKTINSCEGHIVLDKDTDHVEDYRNAYIMFDPDISRYILKTIIAAYPLPDGWEIDEGLECFGFEDDCICIRYTKLDNIYSIPLEAFMEIKQQYLYDIMVWSKTILTDHNSGMVPKDE